MARCSSAIALAAACAASLGCGGTERSSAYAVWSDDQSEALVIINHWTEGDPGYMGIRRRDDFRFEAGTYALDGTRLRTLIGESGGAGVQAWHMRSAGYSLVSHVSGDPGDAGRVEIVERVSLDGSRRTLWTGPAAHRLPSPDGSVIATFDVPHGNCAVAGAPPTMCSGAVAFADARTGANLAEPTPVTFANTERWYFFWDTSMALHLYVESRAFPTGYSSVTVRPGESALDVPPPPCTQETPRPAVLSGTSSDYVSRDGRILRASVDEDDNVTLTVEDTGMPGWPGRCFP